MTEASITTSDTINVPNDSFRDRVVEFVEQSALSGCTIVQVDDLNYTTILARWPAASFSSGEKALWGVLQSLCSGDLRHVLDRCDLTNVAALARVVSSLAVTS